MEATRLKGEDLPKLLTKGQAAIGAALGFVTLALAMVMGIIGYIVLNTVVGANANATGAYNFTGMNFTIVTFVPTLFLVGILVTGAMAAFVAMKGFGHE